MQTFDLRTPRLLGFVTFKVPSSESPASPDMSTESKRWLKAKLASLNPFELHRRLEEGLRAILHRPLHSSRPSDSLHCAADAGTSVLSRVS